MYLARVRVRRITTIFIRCCARGLRIASHAAPLDSGALRQQIIKRAANIESIGANVKHNKQTLPHIIACKICAHYAHLRAYAHRTRGIA